MMQPLVSGYLNFYELISAPINANLIKNVIEGLAPYHIVSE